MKRLFILLMAALLTCAAWGQSTVTYYAPTYTISGNDTTGVTLNEATCSTYTTVSSCVSSSTVTWGTTGNDSWYVIADGAVCEMKKGIECLGNVHLILGKNSKLKINQSTSKTGGFIVEGSNTLTIYSQVNDNSGQDSVFTNGGSKNAGIGGRSGSSNGKITINGGYVYALGGSNAAGIGGGNNAVGSNIIVNGGVVVAISNSNGAGIGGGYHGDGREIMINGGTVYAYSKVKGAGIGGGCLNTAGVAGTAQNIRFNGGEVYAYGGTKKTSETPNGAGANGVGRGYTDAGSQVSGKNISINCDTVIGRKTSSDPEVIIKDKTSTSTTKDWASDLNGYRIINIKKTPLPPKNPVSYIRPIYSSTTGADSLTSGITKWVNAQCSTYTEIKSIKKDTTLSAGWYVTHASDNITANTITCSGNVHLILADNSFLSVASGFVLESGSSLTIYAQSRDYTTMGSLYMTNGGTQGSVASSIVINGGFVIAINPNFAVAGSSNVYVNHGVVYVNCSTSTSGIGSNGGVYFNDIMMVRADDNSLPVQIVRHANCSTSVRGSLAGMKYATAVPINIFKHAGQTAQSWNDSTKWSDGKVPTGAENVAVYSACSIPANMVDSCGDLCIYSPVTLQASSALYAGQISNPDAANLVLQQDESNSSTVYFTSGSPKATVGMYFKGKLNKQGNYDNPDWQYRGFVGTPDASQSLADVHIYKWDETMNKTNPWVTPDKYEPWKGYCMANWTTSDGLTRSYTTTLSPIDTVSYSGLSKTSSGTGAANSPNLGVHLLTNSLSAPVRLVNCSTAFTYTGVDQTFYFFKTRSHEAWRTDKKGSIVTYPVVTGEYLEADTLIPAGGSFAVKVSSSATEGSLTIPSTAFMAKTSGAMYKPAKPMPVVSVRVESETAGDELFLVVSEVCGKGFDNGYDGTKMFASNAPQVYATNDFGLTAVNADSALLGQYVGYRGVGGKITVSLHVRDLEGYRELYLYDRVKGNYMKFGEDTLRYEVEVSGSDEPQRFQICGVKENGYKFMAAEEPRIDIINNVAWLVNVDRGERVIRVVDAAGRTLWSENATGRESVELPDLPAGVYFVNCGGATGKWISK